MAERKGQQGFILRNSAKLIFCSNDPPGFADKGSAVAHRLMVIPFNRVLTKAEANEGIKKTLFAEIPGILALLVRRIRDNLEKNGGVFKVSSGGVAAQEAQHQVLHASSTVHEFLRDTLDYGAHLRETDFVVASEIYPSYLEWAKSSGQKFTKTKRAFYLELNGIIPDFCRGQVKKVGRASTKIYPRMKFNKGEIEIL
jgi:phage/plasmid-associated DNA primase